MEANTNYGQIGFFICKFYVSYTYRYNTKGGKHDFYDPTTHSQVWFIWGKHNF